jgi:hypothetical protein
MRVAAPQPGQADQVEQFVDAAGGPLAPAQPEADVPRDREVGNNAPSWAT